MAAGITAGVSGVNRKITKITAGVSGVNRLIKTGWAGVGGVNRQVFASELKAAVSGITIINSYTLGYDQPIGDAQNMQWVDKTVSFSLPENVTLNSNTYFTFNFSNTYENTSSASNPKAYGFAFHWVVISDNTYSIYEYHNDGSFVVTLSNQQTDRLPSYFPQIVSKKVTIKFGLMEKASHMRNTHHPRISNIIMFCSEYPTGIKLTF